MATTVEPLNIYDLKRLFYLRETLEHLDPRASPQAFMIDPRADLEVKRLGILSGSFNPPTIAHLELAVRARESYQLDGVFFLISRVTIDKPDVDGLALEDRLLLLSRLASELGWASVVATNRGLYYEQAAAMRALAGRTARMFFLVGMDKVAQILDPSYYENRDHALLALFIEAQLIAGSRGNFNEAELQKLLGREDNQNYADRVYFLSMPARLKQLASSAIRSAIARGESADTELPQAVAKFITESGAYRSSYEVRRRLMAELYFVRDWAQERIDFRRLVTLASENTESGRELRALLESPEASSTKLKELLEKEAIWQPAGHDGAG